MIDLLICHYDIHPLIICARRYLIHYLKVVSQSDLHGIYAGKKSVIITASISDAMSVTIKCNTGYDYQIQIGGIDAWTLPGIR